MTIESSIAYVMENKSFMCSLCSIQQFNIATNTKENGEKSCESTSQ